MTDLRKAAEQALEALESVYGKGKRCEAAIKALRQALAQSEQEPLGGEWVPCVKLPVIVHVRNQRDGETHISTREGITPVLPEDLIMRGVAGEEYPIGRELFERTYTFDVDAVNMSQERVDETAKDRLVRIMGTFDLATGHADTMEQVLDALEDELRDVLGHLRVRHEWVGLTDEEIHEMTSHTSLIRYFEAKLKEKNI